MSSKPSSQILVLTSKTNFVWTSMQEIIPMIENSWVHMCNENNFNIQILDVDNVNLSLKLKDLIESKLIVVTCFNAKMAQAIKIIRDKFQVDTRIVFYLHGLATIALWPLERFDVLRLMNSTDIFVGTCNGDLRCLEKSFSNAQAIKIPFTIDVEGIEKKAVNSKRAFVYVGRISPQKNLDQLILGYSRLDKDIRDLHPLILYGKEDHLGYPNHGLHDHHYLKGLQYLIKETNLESSVHFRGFVNRLDIQSELGEDYIFITPTTHSDENFGMAAFRSLIRGSQCILSDWGGHKEFKKDYADQITFLRAHLTSSGPSVSHEEITDALKKSLLKPKSHPLRVTTNFSLNFIAQELKKLVLLKNLNTTHLKKTEIADIIHRQQCFFETEFKEPQRCFKSFEDPSFIAFFEAYSK